jgi:hypothetical protein
MKKATVAVFLLLSVLMAFGRNVTDQEVATALKRALRARDNLSDTAEVQVSSALATGKDICIEYRASTASGQSVSGLAVYRTEDELVFLDNSWIWERACLSGKYGQRRNGKDLTSALNASLAVPVPVKPAAIVAVAAPAPAAPPVPAPVIVASAHVQPSPVPPPPSVAAAPTVIAHTSPPAALSVQQAAGPIPASVPAAAPVPTPLTTPAPAQAIAKAAPAVPPVVEAPPPTPVAIATATPPTLKPTLSAPPQVAVIATPSAPAASPTMAKPAAMVPSQPTPIVMASMTVTAPAVGRAPVATPMSVVSAPPSVATVAQPAPIISAPIVAAPTVQSSLAGRNPAASTETPLHGVTIIDNDGALGSPTSTVSSAAPVESLADVARRVRGQRTMQ